MQTLVGLAGLLMLFLVALLGCKTPSKASNSSSANSPALLAEASQSPVIWPEATSSHQASGEPKLCNDCDEPLEAFYVKDRALSYNGYSITPHRKIRHIDNLDVELSYAVLKKNGERLMNFDKVHSALGNETRFGLFPFLGGKREQLVVEQLSNRWWQYWILDLTSSPRLLYESSRYPVSYGLGVEDLDGDGVNELVQMLHSFNFFDRLSNADSPTIPIIFKYDPTTRTYRPASHRFPDVLLDGIEQDIQKADEKNRSIDFATFQDTGEYLSVILQPFLCYVYAGKEQVAWDFFNTHYRLSDKEEMRAKIEKRLYRCEIYRAIYHR